MNIEEYRSSLGAPLKQRTLCFLLKDSRVLLGLKKSGFGKGYWLGIGGKVEDGETVEEAAIREAREEIGVALGRIKRVGTLDFYFPYVAEPDKWNQQVCVFTGNEWEGDIRETEEIRPDWFDTGAVPFGSMWSDAPYWLPEVLQGRMIKAAFLFNKDLSVADYRKTLGEI